MEKQILGDILIVDDELPNLKVLVNILEEQNYKVRKAPNGQSAIKAAQKQSIDLILLDIRMPDMNGYEVCQKLKADDQTKNIPIIFISALNDTFDKVKAFEIGGIDYITKPFQKEEVLARIKSQLIIQSQKRKLQQEIKYRKKIEALNSSILNNSLDGIAALESVRNQKTGDIEDFRFLVINPIFTEIFNQKTNNLNQNIFFKKIIDEINPNLFFDFVEVVNTGLSQEREFSYEYQNEPKWYDFIAVKLGDGFAITIRDITHRKKYELKLNYIATRDGLTGIYNRRTFDHKVGQEWKRCQREKQPLSLILCDIDYFKLYNDFYGHQKGDDCLKTVAKTINNVVKRASDLVARYGGEEFVIILPNTYKEGAIALAEKIQKAIRLKAITHEKSKVSDTVSLSLGIATMIPTLESRENNLIEMADKALYKAKEEGRDRYFQALI